MTTEVATGVLLIVLPIAYNVLFTLLARSFDYPDILRRPTAEVLERFASMTNWPLCRPTVCTASLTALTTKR